MPWKKGQSEPSSTREQQKQIANELLRRRRATESLIAFTEYTLERFAASPSSISLAQHGGPGRILLSLRVFAAFRCAT
jgi:hypothetical protein